MIFRDGSLIKDPATFFGVFGFQWPKNGFANASAFKAWV